MTAAIGSNPMFCQSDKVVATNLDREIVMMHVERGHYYGLDSVGTAIWEFTAEPKSFSDICDYLVSQYAVERVLCEADVREFLEQMVHKELLAVEQSADGDGT